MTPFGPLLLPFLPLTDLRRTLDCAPQCPFRCGSVNRPSVAVPHHSGPGGWPPPSSRANQIPTRSIPMRWAAGHAQSLQGCCGVYISRLPGASPGEVRALDAMSLRELWVGRIRLQMLCLPTPCPSPFTAPLSRHRHRGSAMPFACLHRAPDEVNDKRNPKLQIITNASGVPWCLTPMNMGFHSHLRDPSPLTQSFSFNLCLYQACYCVHHHFTLNSIRCCHPEWPGQWYAVPC